MQEEFSTSDTVVRLVSFGITPLYLANGKLVPRYFHRAFCCDCNITSHHMGFANPYYLVLPRTSYKPSIPNRLNQPIHVPIMTGVPTIINAMIKNASIAPFVSPASLGLLMFSTFTTQCIKDLRFTFSGFKCCYCYKDSA